MPQGSQSALIVRSDQIVVREHGMASVSASKHKWVSILDTVEHSLPSTSSPKYAAAVAQIENTSLAKHVERVLLTPSERFYASIRLDRPIYTNVWLRDRPVS